MTTTTITTGTTTTAATTATTITTATAMAITTTRSSQLGRSRRSRGDALHAATGPAPIQWYACRAPDQAAGEFGGLIDRDCTEPDPADPTHTQCGFIYAGDCADYTPVFPSPYACESFDATGTYYTDCHTPIRARVSGRTRPGSTQVITTYVTNPP